jgi:hypothetical protein
MLAEFTAVYGVRRERRAPHRSRAPRRLPIDRRERRGGLNTFGKIGQDIATEMNRRRTEFAAGPAQSDAVKIFQQQIIRMTVDVNDEVRRRLNLP